MIQDLYTLNKFLKTEKQIYYNIGYKGLFHFLVTKCEVGFIWQYICLLRVDEFLNNSKYKVVFTLFRIFIRRKRNKLGIKIGCSIPINTFDVGLTIYHASSIIVNKNAKIGKNCKLHGMNCIGNSGISDDCPLIGDNVDISIGSIIIGDVNIASNTIIGANSVVNKSIFEENCIFAGSPAKFIKRIN